MIHCQNAAMRQPPSSISMKPIADTTGASEMIASEPNRDSIVLFLTGQFEPDTHPSFVPVQTIHADRSGLYLQREVYEAFIEMSDLALRDGHQLVIRSATRNFEAQKLIWERKWRGEVKLSSGIAANQITDPTNRALAILKFSSMPGTSRHHWGTDLDLNAFNNRYFESGPGLEIYRWLQKHAPSFGFCQPYTAKGPGRPNGFEEEKWHWTYMPIAQVLQNQAAQFLVDSNIVGFAGAEQASAIHIVEKYILGIDPTCN